jgi:NAD(P)-dependent dehydrogenase (short-subunit alcohol dehydrogenase family)
VRNPVAFVTGAARGIGRGIAEKFLREGWSVVLADLRPEEGRRTAAALARAGDASFVRTDVAGESSVRRALAETVRRHGRLDALVNNAGLVHDKAGLDSGWWRKILATNLTGAFYCAKHAAPHLKKTRGAVVNIASTRALMSEGPDAAYAAAKGGLVALTHSLAMALGPEVRVNCVSPGWIDTGKYRLRPKDHRQHPVGRAGRPEDVAALAYFLASPEAGFITGQNYVADGGMTRKMIYV